MKLKGKVWRFADNVNTDDIIPARYLSTTDPGELGRHCLEGINMDFAGRVSPGDIIVAGKNFGCGSSREHAPLAIKGCGVSCVIAQTFARIFYRNCINMGLPLLECPQAPEIEEGDKLEIDLTRGEIRNLTKNKTHTSTPFPGFMKELIEAGGLMEWVKRK